MYGIPPNFYLTWRELFPFFFSFSGQVCFRTFESDVLATNINEATICLCSYHKI